MNHPDFKAFLLDRKLEKTKIGKEWRFYLVQSILVNTSSRNIFPEAFLHSLDKYVREGPYYLDPTMSVAFQST